jgi:autotransporter-associated beta strand protein
MTSGSYASSNSILVGYTNSTGLDIVDLSVSYTIERYRRNTANASVTFATNTSASSNTWTDQSATFSAATFATGSSVYDFSAATTVTRSGTLTNLAFTNTNALYFQWLFNTTGSNSQGLGLDDVTFRATKLATNGTDRLITTLTGLSDTTIQNGHSTNASTLTATLATTQTFAGVLQDGGAASLALTKSGIGTLNLTNANTYSGGTSISDGTISLGHSTNTLADGGTVLVNGGTLNVNNPDTVGAVTISSGSISGSSTLTGSSYALTNTGTISATLAGAGTLTKTGSGTATISSANTYTGGTTISGGTLNVTNGSGSATGTGALTLDSTGTLSGTGIIAPATNTNINLNGSLVVGNSTLGSPVASSITLTTSGSGVTTTSTSSLFHFDLFTRIGGSNPLGSAADYIKLPGTLNNTSVGPNLGTIVITNRTGGTTFALGDSWHLFDFTGGGTITDDFNVDYTNLGLSGDLIGQFDRLSGTFSIVPEPSRTLFLALGLLTLTLRRRR